MSKKSGKSIKEKRAEKRAGVRRPTTGRTIPPGRSDRGAPEPGGHRHLLEGERAPAAAPPRAPVADPRASSARRITLEHGYGERFGYADSDLADSVAGFATRGGDPGRLRRRAAAQAAARGRRGDEPGTGAVGLAALRPGPGDDPARRSTGG